MERNLPKLSLDEVCERLENSRLAGACGGCHSAGTPNCPGLLVNEIGVMAVYEGSKKAEAKLRDIMEWPEEELRGVAYFYAVLLEPPDEEMANAIVAFGARPENQEIMKRVDEYFKTGILSN
jgi:hypothetical protein